MNHSKLASPARIAFLSSVFALSATACQKEKKAESKDDAAPAATAKPGDIPAPDDVAKPPADAKKTEKGVFYKELQAPTDADDKPTADDTVKVHYTGWTTDGKMFDSSIKRGNPATFGLGQVIPGWTDGLQVMGVGGKTRFWIPEELAYKGRGGAPQGMLVFDVELLEIKRAPKAPEDVAAAPADAKKTAKNGIAYRVLSSGPTDGKSPRAWDRVEVHYTGWTAADGKLIDTTSTRDQTAKFALDQRGVLEGWSEVLQEMKVGDEWIAWIPQELAYKGAAGRPEGALTYQFKLEGVSELPEPPKAPEDVAKPPKNAKKTKLGVFYKVLQKGKGGPKPAVTDKVEVHYTGWTTDGKMFDSSVSRGRKATFGLNQVIAGWTDGLQVMSVGDKVRFWIPEEHAYKGMPGKPAGMLVFDVELFDIKEGTKPKTEAPKAKEASKGKPATEASEPGNAKPGKSAKPTIKKSATPRRKVGPDAGAR